MKLNGIKKLGRASLLAAVFATAATPTFAQGIDGRGPNGTQQYASLTREISALGDINAEIARTMHTAKNNGVKPDPFTIQQLQSRLTQGEETVAPKIILARGLSTQDVQMLLDQFKQQAGPLPDYLAKVSGKARLVAGCREQLAIPGNAADAEHAAEVANCVASTQDAAPVMTTPPIESQPVAPPAPVNSTPVTTPADPKPAPRNHSLSKLLVDIGEGALVLGLGAGLTVAFLRRRKKPANTQPVQEAVTVPPPSPPPMSNDAPPKQPSQPDTAAAAPGDKGPAKKPHTFDI